MGPVDLFTLEFRAYSHVTTSNVPTTKTNREAPKGGDTVLNLP